MKIISFNIWDLPFLFVKERYKRVGLIAKYLSELDADIICLQESFDVDDRKLIYNFLASKGYYATRGLDKKRLVPFTILDTTGGLVIFSKFKIKEDKFTPFKIFEYSIFEYFGRKGILEAVLETPAGSLYVVNSHLHSGDYNFDQKIRSSQLKRIFEIVSRRKELPAIFTGDLNQHGITDTEDAQLFLENGFIHPVLVKEEIIIPSYRLENPLVNRLRTKKSARLDYIFVKNITKYNFKIDSYSPIHLKPALSDHDPVMLLLSR